MKTFRNCLFTTGALSLMAAAPIFLSAQTVVPGDGSGPHIPYADSLASSRDTTPTFTLTLKGGLRDESMTEFKVGSTVWITITMTNITSHEIETSSTYTGGVNNAYTYEVLDDEGKPATKIAYSHPELVIRQPYLSSLLSGGSAIHEDELNKMYKLDHPGKYFVRVYRNEPDVKDEKGDPLVEKSNVITITILPAEDSGTSDAKK